jgi:hypothetical protein
LRGNQLHVKKKNQYLQGYVKKLLRIFIQLFHQIIKMQQIFDIQYDFKYFCNIIIVSKMKKLYTLVVFCVAAVFVSAQSFTLTPKISSSSVSSNGSRDMICNIKNNTVSDADNQFTWTILKYIAPGSWDMSFCDPDNCYAGINVTMSKQFTINRGMTGQIKASYTFNNVGGIDTMKVLIKSVANPSNTDTITFVVNAWMTGVNEIGSSKDISFYPNPVKDQLTVKYSTNSPVVVDIYNIIGVKVKSFTHDGASSTVNVSDLQNGVYFIRIKGTSYSKSFTKSE